ncbi:MAG TPA: 50S ribosomal protein L32 [Thermodesulfobacteriota bacterium]|nr:50S ribosomal protein L32 [Thermodesulfobacteriota bacterium]
MALPKRKKSTSKSKKGRTHYKVKSPGASECPNCSEIKPPHRACPSCGFYKGNIYKVEKEELEEEIED